MRLIEPNLPRRICFSLEDGTSGTIRAFKWFSRDEGVDTLNREQAMSIKYVGAYLSLCLSIDVFPSFISGKIRMFVYGDKFGEPVMSTS